MINLRPHQIDAIQAIKKTFKASDRQYIEMPTGSGKTITFLAYAKVNHESILIIVPSKELLNQVYQTALKLYNKEEISRKGNRFDEPVSNVHICIINSIRGDYFEELIMCDFDLIIIDEAHHSQSNSYKRFINQFAETADDTDCFVKILGVTATPDRLDGKLLNEILHICSYRIKIEELIIKGFLSDIEGFSIKTNIDLSHVHDHNGDFSLRQLYTELCIDSRNKLIIDCYKDHMQDRKVLIFCINIAHSKIICKLLNESGILAKHIDGTMDGPQREAVLSAFRDGEISVLCNCQLLTEGFDEPSIDGIILSRPTRSNSLFLQMIGRGLRIFPNKQNCKIIDIVDNHKNLSGFNNTIADEKLPEIKEFKRFSEISDHIAKERLKISEFQLERINLFSGFPIDGISMTSSMEQYLKTNDIPYFEPVSFDEASFLIWLNELKKEYTHARN